MIEVLVWLLVSTSWSSSNSGNVVVLERFKTQVQCEHVKANIPKGYLQEAKCIQTNIYIKG